MSCTVIPHPLFSISSVQKYTPPPPYHCFCPSGKAKAMQMQASKDSVHSSFPSSKPQSNAPKKSITPVLYTPPTPPLPTPPARPRRARQEAPKPVVLVLPRVHFPNFFPPQLSRTGSIRPKLRLHVEAPSSKRWPI